MFFFVSWSEGRYPEPDSEAPGRGPPGSGRKVELVVKSLVIDWPGLEGLWGPRYPGQGYMGHPHERCSKKYSNRKRVSVRVSR